MIGLRRDWFSLMIRLECDRCAEATDPILVGPLQDLDPFAARVWIRATYSARGWSFGREDLCPQCTLEQEE